MQFQYGLKPEVEKILRSVKSENVITFNPLKDDYLIPNFTVNCFFEKKYLKPIVLLIKRLRKLDPSQLFYRQDQLHITLLGQIDMHSTDKDIINTVQDFLSSNKINFHLFGVGSSTKVASVTAYPDFRIDELRRKLRLIGGGTKFDGPYEQLAWVNFMRYKTTPKPLLLKALMNEVNSDFGILHVNKVKLLSNSSRTLINSEVIHNFDI